MNHEHDERSGIERADGTGARPERLGRFLDERIDLRARIRSRIQCVSEMSPEVRVVLLHFKPESCYFKMYGIY